MDIFVEFAVALRIAVSDLLVAPGRVLAANRFIEGAFKCKE